MGFFGLFKKKSDEELIAEAKTLEKTERVMAKRHKLETRVAGVKARIKSARWSPVKERLTRAGSNVTSIVKGVRGVAQAVAPSGKSSQQRFNPFTGQVYNTGKTSSGKPASYNPWAGTSSGGTKPAVKKKSRNIVITIKK